MKWGQNEEREKQHVVSVVKGHVNCRLRACEDHESPILKVVHGLARSSGLPACRDDSWEEARAGSHLCFVLDPMSIIVQAVQLRDADHERLLVHVVQRIVQTVTDFSPTMMRWVLTIISGG